MAKSKQIATDASNAGSDAAAGMMSGTMPSNAQVSLAEKCVRAVTGCGQPEAEVRVKKMGASKVAQLAELESAGKRKDAVQIVYGR